MRRRSSHYKRRYTQANLFDAIERKGYSNTQVTAVKSKASGLVEVWRDGHYIGTMQPDHEVLTGIDLPMGANWLAILPLLPPEDLERITATESGQLTDGEALVSIAYSGRYLATLPVNDIIEALQEVSSRYPHATY